MQIFSKLMKSEGIIPIQAGTNKFASQKGITGKSMCIWKIIIGKILI